MMFRVLKCLFLLFLLTAGWPVSGLGAEKPDFSGQWVLIPGKSAEIGLYKILAVDVPLQGDSILYDKQEKRRNI